MKDFSALSVTQLAAELRRYARDIEAEGRSYAPACMRAAADRLEAPRETPPVFGPFKPDVLDRACGKR